MLGKPMEYSSALVIVAPPEVQVAAAPLRLKYGFEGMLRVPAHITILFPFIPLEQLDAVAVRLRQLYADFPPFDVTLDGYGNFPTTTYLNITDPTPIKALFQRVHAAYPQYPPYRGTFGADDITPHMTVGEFTSEIERAAAEFPAYEPITFHVSRLHLLIGVEHEPIPWITHDLIPLGG